MNFNCNQRMAIHSNFQLNCMNESFSERQISHKASRLQQCKINFSFKAKSNSISDFHKKKTFSFLSSSSSSTQPIQLLSNIVSLVASNRTTQEFFVCSSDYVRRFCFPRITRSSQRRKPEEKENFFLSLIYEVFNKRKA